MIGFLDQDFLVHLFEAYFKNQLSKQQVFDVLDNMADSSELMINNGVLAQYEAADGSAPFTEWADAAIADGKLEVVSNELGDQMINDYLNQGVSPPKNMGDIATLDLYDLAPGDAGIDKVVYSDDSDFNVDTVGEGGRQSLPEVLNEQFYNGEISAYDYYEFKTSLPTLLGDEGSVERQNPVLSKALISSPNADLLTIRPKTKSRKSPATAPFLARSAHNSDRNGLNGWGARDRT